ncbi:BnaC01g40100D [Brassica napus]|uniref:BnaC01g40100D protein n=1 Tax=Brassica napus TaxID=3708 RepID=A0A078GZF9_BRANA|nr:BnaC01g40100D [Brassica napus]
MGVSKMKLSWSELCPDLLRCVYERLSFTDLIRAKSVCSSWHSASRGFLPKRNQNPWLDKDKVYKTRDLGVDFARSRCLATYGSWLLMMDNLWNLNVLNPLTGERIDLPALTEPVVPERFRPMLKSSLACLWIDKKTKDYLVVWTMEHFLVFTKRGINTWRRFSSNYVGGTTGYVQMVYDHKAQKLYAHRLCYGDIKIWCFCGDDEPQEVFEAESACLTGFTGLFTAEYVNGWINIALTVSGQVLKVSTVVQRSKRWLFRIHKISHVTKKWKEIESLGEEALILDMGITVVAKDIPGIKRNSIYFSGVGDGRADPDNFFVFDLATQNIQRLPQCVFSPIHFSDARWFFPGLRN